MAADDRYKMVDTVRDCARAVEDLMNQEVIAVDAEGVHLGKEGPLTLLQVARLDGLVYLFNIYVEPRMIVDGGLKKVLESKDVIKVFHSCSGDSAALKCQFGVMLDNVFDIQAAQYVIDKAEGRRLPNFRKLGDLCALYTDTSLLDDKDKVQEKWYKSDGAYWAKKSFTPEMIDYACADVRVIIPDVYESLKKKIGEKNLQREFQEMVQHELHCRWDSTWTDKTNRNETINSILSGFQGKYGTDTTLEDVTDEDDIAAIKLSRLQNLKDFPEVVRKLKTQSIRTELEKLDVATRDEDFVPMGSHHHQAAMGKKCDDPHVKRLATQLNERIDEIQKKCMQVMYNENTPVNFLAEFERSFIRRLPARTAESPNPVLRHIYDISIKADMDDIDAERRRFLQEGRSFCLPPNKIGLFKFFISARHLPEGLRNKARAFVNELQEKGIIEAPKQQQHRGPRNFNRYR